MTWVHDGEEAGDLRQKLILLPGSGRKSAEIGGAPPPADHPRRFQLIDCRPNLYESLARSSANISLWRRSLLVLRLWLVRISSKSRRRAAHGNDNHR